MSSGLSTEGSTIPPNSLHLEEHVVPANSGHDRARQNEDELNASPLAETRPSSSSSSSVAITPSNHGTLERTSTAAQKERGDGSARVELTRTVSTAAAPIYSVFGPHQKRFIVFMAGWAGFFSAVSANIYFPALNPLASDLNVSNSLINLTLTSYMIFQGLAPAFIGDLADSMGRRVAYAVCFIIYIAANIGLALQNSYVALFILRCLQSTGSSATIAMASAVVSDVATAAERGSYMGFTLAGSLIGPAIGPVIGGLLSQFLGWRAIFWFLTILASTFFIIFAIFFPETARKQVGNGSIPPKGWSMSLMNYLAIRKARNHPEAAIQQGEIDQLGPKTKIRFPNPLSCLHIIADKENALLLFYNSFVFAAFYDITASIPSQFAAIFGFNDLQIGLCYLPFGVGSMLAAIINGQILDRNFARWCRKLGIQIRKGRNQDLRSFPIEKARLQIALPACYVVTTCILIYGWLLDAAGKLESNQNRGFLAGILVILFCSSFSMGMAFNVTSTLLIDFYPTRPATATAANNLTRCLLGAGATGVLIPMLDGMGRGWTFTFLALFLFVTSPMLWMLYFWGMGWREQRRVKEEENAKRIEEAKAGKLEEGRIETEKQDNTAVGMKNEGTLIPEQSSRPVVDESEPAYDRGTDHDSATKQQPDELDEPDEDLVSGESSKRQVEDEKLSHDLHPIYKTSTHESGF